MLVLAGCLGGVVLGIGFDAGFTMKNGVPNLYLLPGHITWQVLVCLALYYGSERITPPPARSGSFAPAPAAPRCCPNCATG